MNAIVRCQRIMIVIWIRWYGGWPIICKASIEGATGFNWSYSSVGWIKGLSLYQPHQAWSKNTSICWRRKKQYLNLKLQKSTFWTGLSLRAIDVVFLTSYNHTYKFQWLLLKWRNLFLLLASPFVFGFVSCSGPNHSGHSTKLTLACWAVLSYSLIWKY